MSSKIPSDHVASVVWTQKKGEAIQLARETKGWYRPELAGFVGCSFQFIQKIEDGSVKSIKMSLLECLCLVLELDIVRDVLDRPPDSTPYVKKRRRKRRMILPEKKTQSEIDTAIELDIRPKHPPIKISEIFELDATGEENNLSQPDDDGEEEENNFYEGKEEFDII